MDQATDRADVQKLLREYQRMGEHAFDRNRIFGDPVTHGDVVLVPVGWVAGGGGGGEGQAPKVTPGADDAEGSGHGWGMVGQAIGAYVIRDGQVSFVPAIDVTKLAAIGMAGLVLLTLLKRRRR